MHQYRYRPICSRELGFGYCSDVLLMASRLFHQLNYPRHKIFSSIFPLWRNCVHYNVWDEIAFPTDCFMMMYLSVSFCLELYPSKTTPTPYISNGLPLFSRHSHNLYSYPHYWLQQLLKRKGPGMKTNSNYSTTWWPQPHWWFHQYYTSDSCLSLQIYTALL